jgi:hypothetical protein
MMSRYEELAQKFTHSNCCWVQQVQYCTLKLLRIVWMKCRNVAQAKEGIPMDQHHPHLRQNLNFPLQSAGHSIDVNIHGDSLHY